MIEATEKRKILYGPMIFFFITLIVVSIFSYAASREESQVPEVSEASSMCDVLVAKDNSGSFTSIQDALDKTAAGKTICVKPGRYTEGVVMEKAGVTLTAYDKNKRPVIDGDKDQSKDGRLEYPEGKSYEMSDGKFFTYNGLVSIENKDITFSYFEVRNSKGAGINIYSKKNPLTNNHIHHNLVSHSLSSTFKIHGPGTHSGDTSGTIVEENIFQNSGQSWLYTKFNWSVSVGFAGANDVTFRRNVIRHSFGGALLADSSFKRSKNIIIESNIIYDTMVGLINIHASDNVIVRNNFIFSSPSNPVQEDVNWTCINFQGQETASYNKAGPYGISGAKIYNNIGWGCRLSVGVHAQSPGSYVRNVEIFNNTFVNAGSSGGETPSKAGFADFDINTQTDKQQGRAENVKVWNNIFAHSYEEGQKSISITGSGSGVNFTNNFWASKPNNGSVKDSAGIGDPKLKGKTGKGDFPAFKEPPTMEQIFDAMTWFQLRGDSQAINKSKDENGLGIDFNGFKRDKPNDLGAMEVGTKPEEEWGYDDPPFKEIQIDEAPIPQPLDKKPSDINDDGEVDIVDISIILQNWHKEVEKTKRSDLNSDGYIDILDISLLLHDWGK